MTVSLFEQDALGVGPEILARFWAKVDFGGPIPSHCPELGRCWLWSAAAGSEGYGQFFLPSADGKRSIVRAHRVAYELACGSLAGPHIKVCHHCDVTLCVRHSHLFAGTQSANLEDARDKGRLNEKLPRHYILTYQQRIEIYRSNKRIFRLAAEYGVSQTTIANIKRGRFAKLPGTRLGPAPRKFKISGRHHRDHEGVAAPQFVQHVTR